MRALALGKAPFNDARDLATQGAVFPARNVSMECGSTHHDDGSAASPQGPENVGRRGEERVGGIRR